MFKSILKKTSESSSHSENSVKYHISDGIDDDIVETDALIEPSPEVQDVKLTNITQIETVETNNIANQISEYVTANKPKVYILTPCFGGMCYVNYIQSMVATMDLFRSFQIPLKFEFCKSDSLVPRARNNLIAKAMADPDTTHVLFIDNDIMWNPVDILRMIVANKPLIGGIYPLKRYDWSKLVKDPLNPYNTNLVQSILTKKRNSSLNGYMSDEAMIQASLLKYNVNYLTNYMNIENNTAKVRHIPTGFMLIQRTMIETMFEAYKDTKYTDDVGYLETHENPFAYALFDCGVEDGHYFSEDWLFCERWLRIGGEVWADVSVNLTHTGTEDYRGSYIASMV
jgi:hypothetical protein